MTATELQPTAIRLTLPARVAVSARRFAAAVAAGGIELTYTLGALFLLAGLPTMAIATPGDHMRWILVGLSLTVAGVFTLAITASIHTEMRERKIR